MAKSRPSSHKAGALLLGIGDDAAVLRGVRRAAGDLVLSCDAFLENVHFLAAAHPPDAIGYKALARATSDLAAMGATPRFFMLSLALPPNRTGAWLDALIKGMARAATEFGMALIGGDTSKNATVIMNMTVGGEVAAGHALTRSGARPGDGIYVSGTLGAAQLGLELILSVGIGTGAGSVCWSRTYVRKFSSLWANGWRALRIARPIASAATDTSDGLSTDLTHICQASGVSCPYIRCTYSGRQIAGFVGPPRIWPPGIGVTWRRGLPIAFYSAISSRTPNSERISRNTDYENWRNPEREIQPEIRRRRIGGCGRKGDLAGLREDGIRFASASRKSKH